MLRKLLKFIIPLGVFLILVASEAVAGGLALTGVGSRAISMGGAFRGLADDWSACYWNPAGLAYLDKSEFNGMLTIISPKPEYTPNIVLKSTDRANEYSIGFKNGTNWYTHDVNHKIPNFSGFFKFPGMADFTAGVGIYVPYGTGAVWDIFDLPNGYNTKVSYPEVDHKSEFDVIDFHPTFAKQVMEGKMSIGLGVSIQKGDIFLQQMVPTQFSTAAPVPWNYFFTNMELDGSGWGYGANAGILYEVNEDLRVGVAYRSPTTLKLEGKASLDLYMPYNPGLVDLYDSYGTHNDSLTANYFRGNVLSAEPDAKADLKLPADYGIGVAYLATEKLTITADLNYTDWARLDFVPINFDGVSPLGTAADDDTLKTNWDSTVRISAGLEYKYSPKLAFRAGYFRDPSPIPDETFTPTIPDIGTKNSFNAGLGYDVGTFRIDYNFEFIQFSDRSIASTVTDPSGGLENHAGDYKMKIYANFISITHQF